MQEFELQFPKSQCDTPFTALHWILTYKAYLTSFPQHSLPAKTAQHSK